MVFQAVPRQLKKACGTPSTYKIVLICAVCLCTFALVVMFEYTSDYRFSVSKRTSDTATKSFNVARVITIPQPKNNDNPMKKKHIVEEELVAIKKKLNLTNNGVISQTEKQTVTNISNTSMVAVSLAPKTNYPLTLESKYNLENPNLCNSVQNLSILIIIHTAPNHFGRRQTIRNTYGNYSFFRPLGNIRVLFLLGTVSDLHVQEHIEEEFYKYSDILQGDFIDAYTNLTLKGVMAYKWIKEKCRNAKAVLKADDDVIINMYKLLMEYLPTFKDKSKTILCNHIRPGTMPIIRDKKSKWYVKENEFKGQKYYPRYCSGFFVMITNDAIPAIYRSAYLTPFFWVDDVYLYGLLPTKVQGITYTGLKRGTFNLSPVTALDCYRNVSRVCDYLVVGARTQEQVNQIWSFMTFQQTLVALRAANLLTSGPSNINAIKSVDINIKRNPPSLLQVAQYV